jgi:hypothetical protein
MRLAIIFLFLLFALEGCDKQKSLSHLFSPGRAVGSISKKIDEASGLAASVVNPGFLWTLNDSGNHPEVFLIDAHAQIRITCILKNIRNRDWEDIAVGKGKKPGINYVYVADIGDNLSQYKYKFIYRFEEPLISDGAKQTIVNIDTLVIHLPDGKRDTETLMINPQTNDLYIVSKREDSVRLYESPYPFTGDTLVPEKILTLPLTRIVAGSISDDGREVLLKNYINVYYWKKKASENIRQLLARPPLMLDYEKEQQGESIAWKRDGSGFYTLSESPTGKMADLNLYKRNK